MRSAARLVGLVSVLMALLGSCGDSGPCTTNCPSIEGVYAMAWAIPPGFEDCNAQPPTPPTMQLAQTGSALRAALGDAGLTGTVYDTWDFTLSGGGLDYLALRGRAVTDATSTPDAGSTADAGHDGGVSMGTDAGVHAPVHLVGTLTWAPSDGGCQARRSFTGDRQ